MLEEEEKEGKRGRKKHQRKSCPIGKAKSKHMFYIESIVVFKHILELSNIDWGT